MRIELAVLGACLIEEPEALKAVVRRVKPEHFALDSHRRIYAAILKLPEPNILLLLEALGRDTQNCGGAAYITDLTSGLPARLGSTVHEYIDRLIEQWRAREVKRISELMSLAEENSEQVIEMAVRHLEQLRHETNENNASSVLSDFASFATQSHAQMDWMVSGLIERGSNGFIAADPKTGKSFYAADLAISLATGSPTLDFSVPVPTKVALVSREDNPNLTAWRFRNLLQGKFLSTVQLQYLDQNLYVNTRAQTPSFMLDNDNEVRNLVSALRERRIEFLILDVLNVLHKSDENDNTQMAEVLRKAKRIQDDTGASLGIIHHFNKTDTGGRITRRLRGASAIAGFAEWIVGISMANEENGVRKMEFELKAGAAPDPIYFIMNSSEGTVRLKRVLMQEKGREGRAN